MYREIVSFSLATGLLPNTITMSSEAHNELLKVYTHEYIPLAYYDNETGYLFKTIERFYGMVIEFDDDIGEDITSSFVMSNEPEDTD